MNKIKKIFLLNLEKRKDKLDFMKFKLQDVNINDYEIVYGIDGTNDNESKQLYRNYLNTLTQDDYVRKQTCIHKETVFAIIKSFKKIFEKVLSYDNNDYILIFEDDVIFHKNFDLNKIKIKTDIVYLGGNQLKWESKINKSYKLINDKKYMTYGLYAVIYKVKFIKDFYNFHLKDLTKIRKPLDYLIWEFIIKNNISNIVIFPNLVIPNLLNSDNMGSRNIKEFCKFKKWNLNNYRYMDLELEYYDLCKNYDIKYIIYNYITYHKNKKCL